MNISLTDKQYTKLLKSWVAAISINPITTFPAHENAD